MNPKLTTRRDIRSLLVNIIGFLLLWEWLRPLKVVTETSELYVFVIFIGICFLLLYYQIRFWAATFIKLFVIMYFIHSIYYNGILFDPLWMSEFMIDFMKNMGLLFQANWWEMTPVFRSFLFFILLWLMTYLVHYWVMFQKRIFLFFVLTIIYITVLDTFSPYDARNAIIRTVVMGFVMLGILQYERLTDKESLAKNILVGRKWAVPLIVFILFSTIFGYVTPKASPQWPDPVPFLKGYGKGNGNGSSTGVQKIGYGTDDSYLGGPFIQDDTVVFTVNADRRHYWRVETKDQYTGKGWEESFQPERVTFDQENTVLNWYEAKAQIEERQAEVHMEMRNTYLTYPAGLTSVEPSIPDVTFSADPVSEKIRIYRGKDEATLNDFKVNYDFAIFPVDQLRQVVSPGGLELTTSFTETYTQLPEKLPKRVYDLAKELTESESNRYDKVKAVESYFQQSNFVYDTQNVATPKAAEDYVDQFIFETQTGYCDNFSSSMIVLLRAVGIPARWVKGYSDGENIEGNTYKITNNNAHSWVEVYFPDFGWVPFEPTKGFSNTSQFNYEITTGGSGQQNNQTEQTVKKQMPLEEGKDEAKGSSKKDEKKEGWLSNVTFSFSWKYFFICVFSALLIGYILYSTRSKWVPLAFVLVYKHRKDDRVYFKAYHALLKQLARVGLTRREGQTLRDYALYVDRFYEGNDMEKLTLSYERALYRQDNAGEEWAKSVELWENLIKKISS